MTPPLRPFHLALPTGNLSATRDFYCDVLGCSLGRTSASWIDLDLFGHQLVFHDCGGGALAEFVNPVDEHVIPIPHFGIVMTPADFESCLLYTSDAADE